MLPDDRYLGLERTLAKALTPLVSELRMTELVTFIDHVVNGREAAVAEIVDAAAELHYAPGFIGYDRDADVSADWNGAPSVALGVRIATGRLVAHVRLTIRADHASIELQHIKADGVAGVGDDALRAALINNALPRGPDRTAPRP